MSRSSALWLPLGSNTWVIRQALMVGFVRKRKDKDGWAVVKLTVNEKWSMGMRGLDRRTVYRPTLESAKATLERHWQNT